MRFLGKTANFPKSNDIRNKTKNEQPGAALYGEQNAPAKNKGNCQIRNDCQKKFHGAMLMGSRVVASVVFEDIKPSGEPGVLATPSAFCAHL